MKIEWAWRYEFMHDPVEGKAVPVVRVEALMDDPVEGETVPVVRVEALRAFLNDIDDGDLEYATLREQARQLLTSLKEQP